jgi:OOP family OmpA-OmpF porin
MRFSFIVISLLVAGAQTAQASPLAEQGLRLLLGEPLATAETENDAASSGPGVMPLPSLSLHFSQPLGTLTNFFGNLSVASTSDHPFKGIAESSVTAIQGGIEWFFTQQQKMQWFLLGGMGSMLVNNGNKPDSAHPMISLGVGQNWALGSSDALRWELRASQTFGHESLPSWTPVNFQAIFSYQWGK